VEFDRTKKGRDLRMQETALHDMIALNDALRHNVVADDKVMILFILKASVYINLCIRLMFNAIIYIVHRKYL